MTNKELDFCRQRWESVKRAANTDFYPRNKRKHTPIRFLAMHIVRFTFHRNPDEIDRVTQIYARRIIKHLHR